MATPLQLQDLPPELLVKIFVGLDGRTLQSISLVNRWLHQVCLDSTPLLYKCALQAAGMVDRTDVPCNGLLKPADDAASLTTQKKLNLLISQEESWTNLEFASAEKKFEINGHPCLSYKVDDFSDGVLVVGENIVDNCESIMHFDLHDRELIRGRIRQREEGGTTTLLDVILSLRDYDLIALIDERCVIYLLQFSSGRPHPLAKHPVIPLRELDSQLRNYEDAKLAICGRRLLIRICRRNFGNDSPAHSKLLLLNWWNGELTTALDMEPQQQRDLVMISKTIALCPSAWERCLRLIQVPTNGQPGKLSQFQTHLVLRLPELKPELEYHYFMECSSKPDLFGEAHMGQGHANLQGRHHKAPFVCSPEDALVRITFSVKRLDDRDICEEFALVTHRKSLMNLLRKFAPGYGSYHEGSFIPMELGWDEWSPHITHIYRLDQDAWRGRIPYWRGALTHDVMGHRLIIGDVHRMILRDFNPYNVCKAREERSSIARLQKPTVQSLNPEDIEWDARCTRGSITIVDEPYALQDSDFFEEPVKSSLPYVESVKEGDFSNLMGFMLGEECIVGLHHDGDIGHDALEAIEVYPI